MSNRDLSVFTANMEKATRRHFRRTQMEVVSDSAVPFDRLLWEEEDGVSGDEDDKGITDYEMRPRVIGVRAFIRFLKLTGLDLPSIFKQLFVAGRAVSR